MELNVNIFLIIPKLVFIIVLLYIIILTFFMIDFISYNPNLFLIIMTTSHNSKHISNNIFCLIILNRFLIIMIWSHN